MDSGPDKIDHFLGLFSGPFPGGARVCVFKNPARRGMILPLPRVLSGSVLRFLIKLRADGPLQPPPNPETLSVHTVRSNFGLYQVPP